MTTANHPEPAAWIEHDRLLVDVPLSCIDGRSGEAVVGSPGGTLGEIVRVAAAVEHSRGHALAPEELGGLLRRLLDALGAVYLHTDTAAVARLAAAVGQEIVGHDAAVSFMDRPPAALVDALISEAARPDHVGCGHLKLLIETPAASEVRPGLTGAVIEAFLRAHWSGDPSTLLQILDGEHDEDEVLVLPSHDRDGGNDDRGDLGRVPTLVPGAGADHPSQFIYHPDASRWLRRQLCALVADGGLGESFEAVVQESDRLAELHLAATIQALAAHLPVRELRLSPPE